MLNVVVLVSGGGTNLQAIIDAVESGQITNTKIAGVISNNKNAYALERAKKHGIPSLCISPKQFASREEFNEQFLEKVNELHPDLIVLAGFLVVIPPAMTETYRNRIINIHPALLPAYGGKGMYGHHVHEAVIAAGEKESGITIHYVNDHYDQGAIIFQAKCPVLPTDTPDDLATRVHELEYRHFPRVIEDTLKKL